MQLLEIFGICFIVELLVVICAVAISLVTSKLDLITKKKNYKKMLEFEKELKEKKPSEKDHPFKDDKTNEYLNELKNNPDLLNEALRNAISDETPEEIKK